jgi:hypothetical protein
MDIEWQGQGIYTLYDDGQLARAKLAPACYHTIPHIWLWHETEDCGQEQEQEGMGMR